MTMMADSPQTSSYCPFGKWMNKETLVSSLNVSTKQLALWVKLQVSHVKAEHGGRVSFHGSPFESSTFYYVTQEGRSAISDMSITLRSWIRLCTLCEEFLTCATSFAISGDFVDLLSKYSGVAIGRTSMQSLLFLVEQLIEQKAVMLSAAFVFKDDVSSVVCQTVNASAPGGKRKEAANITPRADDQVSEKAVKCLGIQNATLDAFGSVDQAYCFAYWGFLDKAWRSNKCTLTVEPNNVNGPKCKFCVNAAKNIKKERYPEMFLQVSNSKNAPMDSIMPTATKLKDALVKQYSSSPSDDAFLTSINWSTVSPCLQQTGLESIFLTRTKLLALCTGCHDECQSVVLVRVTPDKLSPICATCKNKAKLDKRKGKRKRENQDQQCGASSHTNWQFLTPERSRKRTRKRTNQVRLLSKKVKILMDKLLSKKAAIDMDISPATSQLWNNAISSLLSNHKEFESQLLEALVSVTDVKLDTTGKECRDFVASIVNELQKFKNILEQKPKQVRFSPDLLRVALNVWTTSPKAYKELKESGFIILPSQSTLAKLKKEARVKEGGCTEVYLRHAFHRKRTIEFGHLVCDEMKLVEGVAWLTKSHEVFGLAGKLLGLREEFLRILNGNDMKEPAVYVNQWIYRSAFNESFQCDFYYNGGSLPGETLHNQFWEVVGRCEAIKCHVFGLACDAGGGNTKLMEMLRPISAIPYNDLWLSNDYVSVINIYDTSRKIYLWHCTTHGAKAMRNQFYASREGGAKSFRDSHGIEFGWACIVAAFLRDKQRSVPESPDLTTEAIMLEGWSQMNVRLMKALFKDKTLDEIIRYIASLIGVPAPKASDVPERKCRRSSVPNDNCRMLGHYAHMAQSLQDSTLVHELRLEAEGKLGTIRSELASLQYLIVVREIFIEVFMNKMENLTREKIDSYEEYVKSKLDYFSGWKEMQLARQAAKCDDWLKSFLAPETWKNLRIAVAGFFGYARAILSACPDVAFVPFLHSNTSIIEAFFSCQRSRQQINAMSYASGVGTASTAKAIKYLQGNKGYDKEDVIPEEGAFDLQLQTGVFASMNSEVEKVRSARVAVLTKNANKNNVQRFPSSWHGGRTIMGGRLATDLTMTLLYDYATVICMDSEAIELAVLATMCDNQSNLLWFDDLSMLNDEDSDTFNSFCQESMVDLFDRMAASSWSKRNGPLFEKEVQEYIILSQRTRREMLPEKLRNNEYCFAALVQLLAKMLRKWVLASVRSRCNMLTKSKVATEVLDETYEVQQFVGWAIAKMIRQWRERAYAHVHNTLRSKHILEIVMSMRVLHNEAIMDEDYLKTCYNPKVAMANQGGLALVSTPFFPWAKALLKRIREDFSYDIIEKLGNGAIKHAWNRIEKDQELVQLFAQGAKAAGFEGNGDLDVLFVRDSICLKVFHARIEVTFQKYRADNTGRLSKKGAGLSLRENLKVLHQRTLGSKISKEQEAPLELDDDWAEELVEYDGGESSLQAATKIGEEVGVKIKDVPQEATHDVALAKKTAAETKAAKKTTKPKKKRKKKETHDSIRKRLFVVYPT